MTSETNVVPFSASLPAVKKSLAAGIDNVKTELSSSAGGAFLRLTRAGDWIYGADSTPLEEGCRMAINPMTMAHGWIKWTDGQVEDEVMNPISEPRVAKPGEGYDEQYGMQLVVLNGEDEGLEHIYKGTSLGLKKAFRKIIDAISAQIGSDSDAIIPIVEIDVDSYKHKQYGEIFTPVLDVVSWGTAEGDVAGDGNPSANNDADTAAEAKPARRRRSRK